ncbi:hypothetical protein CCR94_06290 [Rhodoblastus sphagnicola]|uniref:Uncharacterized protein n=1 Tax=Rhodoblastus sphagnicola TaxID=333368 RepID=A0A2S6NCB1_9HYPH|nr:hypothetical protein CCR94_06290 [Rhodoblastus sphagnicola]
MARGPTSFPDIEAKVEAILDFVGVIEAEGHRALTACATRSHATLNRAFMRDRCGFRETVSRSAKANRTNVLEAKA